VDVAGNAVRGDISENAAQVGSVDHNRNEAMHEKCDCKNDAEDRSGTKLQLRKIGSFSDRRQPHGNFQREQRRDDHEGHRRRRMKSLIHGQIRP
jgi:hypothetical protein